MNYSPYQKEFSKQPLSVSEDMIAMTLDAVVRSAKSEGRSLAELKVEILADDAILDLRMRRSLSEIVSQVWEELK